MINVDDTRPRSTTVSSHIYGLASRYRANLSEQLKDTYGHASLTICRGRGSAEFLRRLRLRPNFYGIGESRWSIQMGRCEKFES